MNSRLYKVRKVLKMSQVEFGREIGVSGAAISRIEKGERGLTEQMLKSVCRGIPCTPGVADRGDGRDVPMG